MRKAKDTSIAGRLTWMNMLVSGTALVLACATFIAYDVVSFKSTTARNLSTEAQIVGSNAVSALLFNDPQSAGSTLSALHAAPNILSAGIYKQDGQLFASYSRDSGGSISTPPPLPLGQTEAQRFGDDQIVLVRSIVLDGKSVGTVYIQSDVKELKRRELRYVGIAGAVLFVCLLAALLVSAVFRRAIADPIVRLADLARTVSYDKNYSVRATATGGARELSVLVDAFNDMLGQIGNRDRELRNAQGALEQRVRDRTAELDAANKELEAFSYSVSHDLRAPLRSIDGFSLALLEDCGDKLDAGGKDSLNRVRLATQRMSQLIDDLLNLSRVTRSAMQRESVDLTLLAKSIVEDLRKEAPERCVAFAIGEGITAEADSRLLKVVMENLLGNAWKYTSAHKCARIEFGEVRRNEEPTYYVRDDGAGFDARYVDRLFGAFQRLHAATEFPGTGIGLATVQRIIHRHGGQVWAEGAVESGATFYFTL